MKKFILFLIFFILFNTGFSQNYIGKNTHQIINSELYAISPDSTEMWEKKNVILDIKHLKDENKMLIHDLDNYKITTCYIQNDTCVSFMVVYYNSSKDYVKSILKRKYGYNGNDSWSYYANNISVGLCLEEKEKRIFVIEACNFMTENIENSLRK